MKKKYEIDEEENIKITMFMKCNRNFLLEYEYEFVCYICGCIIEKKNKKQITKIQKKKKTTFFK